METNDPHDTLRPSNNNGVTGNGFTADEIVTSPRQAILVEAVRGDEVNITTGVWLIIIYCIVYACDSGTPDITCVSVYCYKLCVL